MGEIWIDNILDCSSTVVACIPADSSHKLLAGMNNPDLIAQVAYVPSGYMPGHSVTVE